MIYVKHFKNNQLYLVHGIVGEYVYYSCFGCHYKRHISQFLSKDEQSETGNKFNLYALSEIILDHFDHTLQNYIDATDYDENGKIKQNDLNIELARELFRYY